MSSDPGAKSLLTRFEDDMEAELRECLKAMPLYDPSDEVFAEANLLKSICIGYNTNRQNPPATIDLEIEGDKCFILHMAIIPVMRRKGVGRVLFGCIEAFCRKRSIKEMIVTPSGVGRQFWPAMGFKPHPGTEVLVKLITIPGN